MALGWNPLKEKPSSGGDGQTVPAPSEHQGLRNALRGAFRDVGEPSIPDDMRQLLAKLH